MKSSAKLFSAAEWLAIAALISAFVISGLLPAWRTMNTDFPNYYIAAAIVRQHIPLTRAYEWRWFQRQKDHLEIDQSIVGFAPHPPMCALPMLPLTYLAPLTAKRVWLIVNLALLVLALAILRRLTAFPWRRILLLTFLCIYPLRQNFLYGQYYVVILLLLCAAYYAATRRRHFTSGALLAVAASLKIFPALFLILFLRKKNWRAAAGLVLTGLALAALSILIFGWDAHQIYLTEVLPRALRGDLVGPYTLQWNSFTALAHRFFLSEPELNPAPLLNSPLAYAVVQPLIGIALLFGFLLSTGKEKTAETTAWEWSTYLVLLILLSSMPTAYHHCVLILSIIVAVDALLKNRAHAAAATAVLCFAVACYPLPGFAWLNLQARLMAVVALYALLLFKSPARANSQTRYLALAASAALVTALALSALPDLHHRAEAFSIRVVPPANGYATFSIAKAPNDLLLSEMVFTASGAGFGAVTHPAGFILPMPEPGDVLSIAAGAQSPFVYFELSNRRSQIFRLPAGQVGQSNAVPEFVAEGRDPAVSPNGLHLAFLTDEDPHTILWLSENGAASTRTPAKDILEMSVTNSGEIYAAIGSAADPGVVLLKNAATTVERLTAITGAVRYPAISPDGQILAFSRRESGSWHLFLRDLAAGTERRLTTAACNATAPAWEDAQTILYVSDCGRGLGLGAPVRMSLK